MASLQPMLLLRFQITEPLPGQVLPEMAAEIGENEAARRYRAIVVTTLRQLRGLEPARLRLEVDPADGEEAVRFWLLPKLADRWEQRDGGFYAPGWHIDFGGDLAECTHQASGEILCPGLGARWVHTAMLGLGRTISAVTGPAQGGGHYFHARCSTPDLPERVLPQLPIIRTEEAWQEALLGPLGAALKKALDQEC